MLAPTREPHLSAFRDHAATFQPSTADPSHAPSQLDVDLARPALFEESWSERFRLWRDDPRFLTAAVVVAALVAGVIFYRSAAEPGPPAVPTDGVAFDDTSTSTSGPAELVVHVSGAVLAPAVYHLPAGTRVGEAIDAAGGAVEGADLERLNLAAPVGDGQRIHVPRPGEPLPVGAFVGAESGTAAAGPLSLNGATAEQLEELPGVGPALAAAIIGERERRGGFRSVDDLLDVEGIGEKRLADLRSLVTV